MSDWIKVEDALPDNNTHVLVSCVGGNVGISFFCLNREFLRRAGNSYSRSRLGKPSGFFQISHQYGYQITHWQPSPVPATE